MQNDARSNPGDPLQSSGQPSPGQGGPTISSVVPPPSKEPQTQGKKWLIIAGAVILVVVLGIVLKMAIAPAANPVSDSSSTASVAPKPKATPAGWPLTPCDTSSYACVPNVTIAHDVVPPLQKLGFTCTPDAPSGVIQACKGTKGDANFVISFLTPDGDPTATRVQEVNVHSDVAAKGQNPPDRTHDAWVANVGNFHTTIETIFAQYPAVKKDLETWVDKQSGKCPFPTLADHDTVDGYEVRCDPIAPIALSGSLGTVTTWSSTITLSAPQAP